MFNQLAKNFIILKAQLLLESSKKILCLQLIEKLEEKANFAIMDFILPMKGLANVIASF